MWLMSLRTTVLCVAKSDKFGRLDDWFSSYLVMLFKCIGYVVWNCKLIVWVMNENYVEGIDRGLV